ncbi:hypothetical protein ScalyP_jg2927, partial [Parmales sp. scaly parma]
MAQVFRALTDLSPSLHPLSVPLLSGLLHPRSTPTTPEPDAPTVDGSPAPSPPPQTDNNRNHPIYNPLGKYALQVYLAGRWRCLVLDDRFPVTEHDEPLLLTGRGEGELWPSLIAKAVYYLWEVTGARAKSDGE